MKHNPSFWLKMFRAAALYVFVTGLLPFLAIFEVTQEPWRLFFDVLTWPLDNNPAQFTLHERQLSAILSGVLCGWALLLFQLADAKVYSPTLRRPMLLSVWLWFIIDSGGSILADLPLNAVSNVSFLLMLTVPLHVLAKGR